MRAFPKYLLREYPKEFGVFRKLDTPVKVQDFVEALTINFQDERETCWSPLETLRHKKAHCMEAAMLAAAVFWYHGRPPLVLDLVTDRHDDDDHVVALFKEGSRWGAVSKTNHASLRYRDPVFRDPRELAMSYFSEYFLNGTGEKTMRAFSRPIDMRRFGDAWLTSKENLFDITDAIDRLPHIRIMNAVRAKRLRNADPIERKAGRIVRWKK